MTYIHSCWLKITGFPLTLSMGLQVLGGETTVWLFVSAGGDICVKK